LVVAVFMAGALAQSFFFIFNETPFSPNQYNWQEPWEVKEMIDFVDAQLTLTGCAYEGQSHDFELVLTNVATVSNYYLSAFDYSAKWYIDESHQESIIAGTYSGDLLGIGESVTYTGVWVPTLIGTGVIKMSVIDIEWEYPKPITWETDIVNNVPTKVTVLNFVVTGASKTFVESGTVTFDIRNVAAGSETISYAVKIVELNKIVGTATGQIIPVGETRNYSHDFDALSVPGTYTMRITVS
jgi:hypothetical protein